MKAFLLVIEEILHCGIALSHPGAVVEQVGNLVKVAERNFDHLMTELCDSGDGVFKGCLHRIIAEKPPVGLCGHADLQDRRRRAKTDARNRFRIGIGIVVVRNDAKCLPGIVDGQGEEDTQSSVRQAGMTPEVESAPTLGLRPTILFRPAGIRPEPAVSVPSAKLTIPCDVATADPELEPPGTSVGSIALRE